MNRKRKNRYKQLREIRRERDYQSGVLQYANRPYTFRSARVNWENGKAIPVYVTTTQFIKKHNITI
ncbi:hypothetical protein [Pseudoneobacillus rhizosphaerae]|jgi:hypothetical protein|uniref:Uncharacterized protein n=1 Tax=Pseudoneobacillus rhizosphaerae TaxID=2880968 RepID=A0A9C7G9B8_9BACI|nr:hypothetical protein [Pseudoneobacillus rhizosphaerae]CAG9608035.1 hypothetical protein NEOCIP111885_01727 [Pseudoneobacillus rhizosphaerae]